MRRRVRRGSGRFAVTGGHAPDPLVRDLLRLGSLRKGGALIRPTATRASSAG
ncbi:MAG: hypothetical protein ACLP5E_08555 [Streptosporangiaceae bacterium]